MLPRPDDRPPSLVMVAAGGVAVLVMVAFVAAVAFGSRSLPAGAGDRVAVGRSDGPAGLELLVQRCPDERVTSVALLGPEDQDLWRIIARKGSIDTRYVVGGDPPTGFTTDVAFAGAPDGLVRLRVLLGDVEDGIVLDPAGLPSEGVRHQGADLSEEDFRRQAVGTVDCAAGPAGDRGAVSWLFAGGAAVVAIAYLGMVQRWWRGRGGSA